MSKPLCLKNKRVLIVRNGGGLGDFLMCTVLTREIKRRYKATVYFQCLPKYAPILSHSPYIDKVINLKEDIEHDYKIDLSHPCPAASYEMQTSPRVKRDRVSLFCGVINIKPKDKRPVYILTKEEKLWAKDTLKDLKRPLVGIETHAGEVWRTYPREHLIKLIGLLKESYGLITFDENKRLNTGCTFEAVGYSIRKIAALMSECNLFIAPDGGLLHLAAALGKKILGLFGPTDPKIRLEVYRNSSWVECKRNCPLETKYCWYYPPKECGGIKDYPRCLRDIEPEVVYHEVRDRLRS